MMADESGLPEHLDKGLRERSECFNVLLRILEHVLIHSVSREPECGNIVAPNKLSGDH